MSNIRDKKVLIIDDDPSIRVLVRKILENMGMRVFEADGVANGVEVAKKNSPHLIILDINMPEANGYVFLEKRRNIAELRPIPVMMLSSHKDRDTIYKSMSLGAIEYMTKPINASQILQKIHKILRKYGGSSNVFNFEEEEEEIIDIQVSVEAEIIAINEERFVLEAPIKIVNEDNTNINSELLKKLNCNAVKKVAAPKFVSSRNPGKYYNHIFFEQLDEESCNRIKAAVKQWK